MAERPILIATDGSDRSDKAVAAGLALAKALGTCVIGCVAIPPYPYSVLAGTEADAEAQYLSHSSAQAAGHLARVEEAARAQGVPYAGVIQENAQPHVAILQVAQTHDAQIIVMASHGRAGVAGMLLGSETSKVLTLADRPVLVLR